MRGVIQVRCQRPARGRGAGLDHALEIAVEGDLVFVLPHDRADAARDVILVEEEHAALARRHPFEGAEMALGKQPAPIGGDQRGRRKIVHHPGEFGIGGGDVGIGQAFGGSHQIGEPNAGERRELADAPRQKRPGRAERHALAFLPDRLAEQSIAPIRDLDRPSGCMRRLERSLAEERQRIPPDLAIRPRPRKRALSARASFTAENSLGLRLM